MRTFLLKQLIVSSVPFLNFFRKPACWPFTLDQHRTMPAGSLGNDVALFLDGQHLELLPKYEVHDTLHVLLRYGTSPLEEMKLQGFMIGNRSATFPGKVLFAIGVLIIPEYWTQLREEIRRGRAAEKIAGYDFTAVLSEQTGTVREYLKISG